MFRLRLHSILRLVMVGATGGWLTLATPALAADVTNVIFDVEIADVGGSAPDIIVEVRVQGTGLTDGKITLPAAPGVPVALVDDEESDDLVRNILVEDEATLGAGFGAGNYQLSLNGGTITATIIYDPRPTLPLPNIQFPGDGQRIVPGTLEVPFTQCGFLCNPLTDDSAAGVFGVLEDDSEDDPVEETLKIDDTMWIPSEDLAENTVYIVRIRHTTESEKPVNTNDDDFGLLFKARFTRSDNVAFETGFAPPLGDFCIEANMPAPDMDCTQLSDPTLSILDPTGVVMTTVAGHDVEYEVTVDSKGRITGDAMADLDDDTVFETGGGVKGKLNGKAGEVKQTVKVSLRNDDLLAKLKLSRKELLSITLDALTGVQKASGKIGDVKIKEQTPTDASPLPVAPQGWRLDFTLDGSDIVIGPKLTLEGGSPIPLEGSNKFDLGKDLTSLKLQSADKGIKIQLKKSLVDQDAPDPVAGGKLSYSVLGQKGKLDLPE